MSRDPQLRPLAATPLKGREHEAREEEAALRLRRAWSLVVGPTLVRQTHLMRIHRGRLVIGCWHGDALKAVRESAEAVYPQVRERVQRLLGVRITGLEVVPCDPPVVEVEMREVGDPFKAMLAWYRTHRN